MAERKIIITKEGIEYGEDLKTLEELLPTMCVSVAYACRALGKNPINAFVAVSEVFGETETLKAFGYIEKVKQTNADWIRNMSNEELAEFLYKVSNTPNCMLIEEDCKYFLDDNKSCQHCFKEWLESERD